MEITAASSGGEARQASRPTTLVARLTAPLRSALADRYQDRFVREEATGQAPAAEGKSLLGKGIDLLCTAAEVVRDGAALAWEKTKEAAAWVLSKAQALSNWVASKIAQAYATFLRTTPEEERRRQEEAAYEKKYQERKAEEKRLDSRQQERRAEETRISARRIEETHQAASRKAVADASAVAALATDRVSAPIPGAEKVQLVDNASLERRRLRRMLTGMLPA